MSQIREIRKSQLIADVELGMKIKPLAEKYSLPVATMRKVLRENGLKIKSTRHEAFKVVDDTVDAPTTIELTTNEVNQ